MKKINYPKSVNLSFYTSKINKPIVKYGLSQNVHFCKSCVVSNQRPNSAIEFSHTKTSKKATIAFDKNNVCDACYTAKAKQNSIDWSAREAALIDLCNRFRRTDGRYDCIVPGSGGKDSFYVAHMLKYKYGMHPLTVTWAPHIYTKWGWHNFQSWIHAGFDNYMITPDGRTHRLLTRLALENLFHPFQPFVLGQKNIAPKMSILFDIPLVFYGENQTEGGNPKSENINPQQDWAYFATSKNKSEICLGGTSVSDLITHFGIKDYELQPYLPADPKRLRRVGTEVHYMGYYLRWHPQSIYYYAVENSNFRPSPERTPGTYSRFISIDDRIDDFHYYTTFIKFGIGRTTYEAAEECRQGDISRGEAISLIKKYDGEFPERFAEESFKYFSLPKELFPEASELFEQPIIDRAYFDALTDTFRSPHLWVHEDKTWKLRHKIYAS